jgi:hypothetical protein
MAVCTEIGNGARTLFWTDRWIHGQKIEDLAPLLFALVPKRRANKRTVLETLTNNTFGWDSCEILKSLGHSFPSRFTASVRRQTHIAVTASNVYTAKSAYDGFFQGNI